MAQYGALHTQPVRSGAAGAAGAAGPPAPAGGTTRRPAAGRHDDLVDHLVRTTHLPAGVARRVVGDVVAYFSEPVEAVVRRRHRELQASGRTNPEIFDRIAAELAARPVAAPPLTARQLRRIVYG